MDGGSLRGGRLPASDYVGSSCPCHDHPPPLSTATHAPRNSDTSQPCDFSLAIAAACDILVVADVPDEGMKEAPHSFVQDVSVGLSVFGESLYRHSFGGGKNMTNHKSIPTVLAMTAAILLTAASVQAGGLDIKPGSCPNSFNPNSKGFLPVYTDWYRTSRNRLRGMGRCRSDRHHNRLLRPHGIQMGG